MMLKHKDEFVDPSKDITAERPESVVTGRTIEDLQREERLPEATRPKFTKSSEQPPDVEGVRVIAIKFGDAVTLQTTSRKHVADDYPSIVRALERQPVDDFVLDGIVDHNKRPAYHVFDLLHLLGQDTTPLSFEQRHKLLTEALDVSAAQIAVILPE
jgi:ATP-dependent DNA ligase